MTAGEVNAEGSLLLCGDAAEPIAHHGVSANDSLSASERRAIVGVERCLAILFDERHFVVGAWTNIFIPMPQRWLDWRQVHGIDTEISPATGFTQALPRAFSTGLYRMVTVGPSLCVAAGWRSQSWA